MFLVKFLIGLSILMSILLIGACDWSNNDSSGGGEKEKGQDNSVKGDIDADLDLNY